MRKTFGNEHLNAALGVEAGAYMAPESGRTRANIDGYGSGISFSGNCRGPWLFEQWVSRTGSP
jgi:hypothetical protein